MKNALIYLILTSLKNKLLDILRTPSKLVAVIIVVFVIVFCGVLTVFTNDLRDEFADVRWFKAIVFGLVTLFFGITVRSGLTRGDSIFGMNDVNLLFVSPLRAQSILLYGVSNMLKTALLAGAFILFQGSSLGNFGLGYNAVLSLLLGYVVAMGLMSIVSLLIYSSTNGRPRRKLAVKIIAPLLFAPVAICFATAFAETGNVGAAFFSLMDSPVFSWTPISGWAAEAVYSMAMGQGLLGAMWLALIVAVGAGILVYFSRSNPDYYEDVLVAAETSFEKQRKVSEGQINMEALSGRKTKIKGIGIGGTGASAIFYKHLRESFRANPLGLWGILSFIVVGAGIAFCAVSRDIESYAIIIPQILLWVQMFLIGTGRGLREIYSHYIYLIPERSFTKILWSNIETVFKIFVESVILFGVGGILVGAPPLLILFCILAYAMYGMLLISVNYVTMRWTGMQVNTGILMILYVMIMMVALAPGVAAGVVTGIVIGGTAGVTVAFAIFTGWQLVASCLCFYLARGVLDKSDMPQVSMMQK
jgi:hypothetical protein